MSMEQDSPDRELDKLYRFLLCFQSQRIPVDLITRACKPKATWSSSGEIVWAHPSNGGIPQWLIDISELSKDLFKHDGAVPGLESLEIVSQYGIRYFEFRDDGGRDGFSDTNDEISTQQCISSFIHAFPCRNTEILAEEVASRLLPLAKTFLLPFLAILSAKDVASWFLPQARPEANKIIQANEKGRRNVEWAICLLDCLAQISIHLGVENRLLPTQFPEKLLDVFRQDESYGKKTQEYLDTFVDMIKLVKSPLPGSFDHFLTTTGNHDKRCNAWAGLSLGLLSSRAPSRSQTLSDTISLAAMRWRPVSMTDPSAMEYLVATELLPYSQLSTIPRPTSLDIELSVLQGFILSRKGSHDEAGRIFFRLVPDAIAQWGETSYQVGITVAECASCYNFLRNENRACDVVTRSLAARRTPQLTNRPDWFYLNIALVDSLIGSGTYEQAASILREVIVKPSIPPIIHMMSCLRLTKTSRRTHDQSSKAFQVNSPLWVGIKLFDKVPNVLREEYLEELSCNLSNGAESAIEDLKAQESLVHAVNSLLQQAPLLNGPAQTRYAQVQQQLQQQITRRGGRAHHTFIRPGQPPLASCHLHIFLPLRIEGFIQRSETEALAKLLLRDSPTRHTLNVHGKVGIGKTSLVTEFIHSYRYSFDVILWIDCDSEEEVTARVSTFAVQLGLVDKDPSKPVDHAHAREQFSKWLSFPVIQEGHCKKLANWLIVLDGMEDEELVDLCQPTHEGGTFIAITRAKSISLEKWADYGTLTYMEIGPLTTEQAVLFFPSTSEVKQSFVSILGNHPSAIIQAAFFSSELGLSAREFIDRYKEAQSSFFIPTEVSCDPHHHEALIMLWFLKASEHRFLKVSENRFLKASQQCKSVMEIISLIGTETPEHFLSLNLACTGWDKYPDSGDFAFTRDQLIEASLIWTKCNRKILVTSAAVQSMFRARMDTDRLNLVWYQVVDMLSYSWPCKFEDSAFIDYISTTHANCLSLWPCASSFAGLSAKIRLPRIQYTDALSMLRLRRVGVVLDLSWCAIKRRLYNEARIFLDMADSFIPDLPEPLISSVPLIMLHQHIRSHHKGWVLRGEMLHSEARASFETFNSTRAFSVPHFNINTNLIRAATLNGLGKVYFETGRVSTSIHQYKKSLDLLGRLGGTAEDYTVTVRSNFGFALLLDNQPKEAVDYFAAGLSDTNTLRRAFRYYGLAIAALCRNRSEECLQFSSDAVNLFTTSFNESYHVIGDVYAVMSNSFVQQSRFNPAT
ncbi:hypothetical protein FDECE_1514 [Fusarium decemcellulare]|nr:hypothetical protein FDECE_1514 [Fusarium decemcellulare]